jgi:hypothetical protein
MVATPASPETDERLGEERKRHERRCEHERLRLPVRRQLGQRNIGVRQEAHDAERTGPGVTRMPCSSTEDLTAVVSILEAMRAVVPLVGVSLAAAAAAAAQGADRYPPTPIGVGPRFHPPAAGSAVRGGRPVAGLKCRRSSRRMGVHVEVFARGRVVIVPAGIGVAAPFVRDGAYVQPRACTYPLRTLAPTGVVEVDRRQRLTLGHLFRLWDQPLSKTRLVGFRTTEKRPVRAYVAGRRWRGRLDAIPLRRHAQIVLQLGRYIRPHKTFLFPHWL